MFGFEEKCWVLYCSESLYWLTFRKCYTTLWWAGYPTLLKFSSRWWTPKFSIGRPSFSMLSDIFVLPNTLPVVYQRNWWVSWITKPPKGYSWGFLAFPDVDCHHRCTWFSCPWQLSYEITIEPTVALWEDIFVYKGISGYSGQFFT